MGAENNINNYILSPGEGSFEFRKLVNNKLVTILKIFKPEMILLSIGFDGHELDDISGTKLISDDYCWVTERVSEVARKYCSGKLISVLEGGYNLLALEESSFNHVAALIKADSM